MDRVDWNRVQEIYAQVVDHPRKEWGALLDKACVDDPPEVRAHVEAILQSPIVEVQNGAAAPSLHDFLRILASSLLKDYSLDAGTRLADRYLLESVVGFGGMGVVYRALDEKFKPPRPVAIKMIGADLAALAAINKTEGEEWLSRFWFEANVLSRMKGQHFVTVFDIGEFQGRLFIVMDFIEGGSLAIGYRQRSVSVSPTARPPFAASETIRGGAGGGR